MIVGIPFLFKTNLLGYKYLVGSQQCDFKSEKRFLTYFIQNDCEMMIMLYKSKLRHLSICFLSCKLYSYCQSI